MGARLRRRSPPPLRQSSPVSTSSSSELPPHHVPPPADPPGGGGIRPTSAEKFKRAGGVVLGLVACAWLAGTVVVLSLHLHRDEPSDRRLGRLPIAMSTVRGGKGSNEKVARPGRRKHRSRKPPEQKQKQKPPEQKQKPPEQKPTEQKLPERKLPRHYFQLSPPTAAEDPLPWSWPIIHIVSTRFMQGQGTLVNLARSRLKLLEVVCLPSLMKQTIFDPDTLAEVYGHTKWEGEVNEFNAHRHRPAERVTDPFFLWIIKVDPNIDRTLLEELKAVLEPVKRFALVVGSNTNFGIGIKPGGWRDGRAGRDVLDAYDDGRAFFPGNGDDDDDDARRTLRRAHEAREQRVVIETRLDADDAVNVDYLAALQMSALRTLVDADVSEYDGGDDGDYAVGRPEEGEDGRGRTARWLYWCPRAHVQWNPSSGADGPDDDPGMLQLYQMPMTCVTAGLSLGFAVGTGEEDVPRYEHSKIYWEVAVNRHDEGGRDPEGRNKHDCGLRPSSRCAVFIEDPFLSAFRSRAVTSAGMHNIEARGAPSQEGDAKYKERAARLWKSSIERHFGIETRRAKEAADFMLANHLGTVRDNLRGQCTHGHSCKISSLEKLQMTIDILEEETGGIEHPM